MRVEASNSFHEIPGGTVFVRSWNSHLDEKPPVVLLHDSLGSVELWRGFPESLASTVKRRVIAYDRLGYGKSSLRSDPPDFAFIDEESETYFPALARSLGLDRYVLLGHSAGGAIALAIAAKRQDECMAVVTESAQAFVDQTMIDGITAAKRSFEDPAQFQRIEKWHGKRARWVLQTWTETWLAPGFRKWSLDALLAKVECPVLAIHGQADEFGSASVNRIVQGVRGPTRMAILEGCGHVPHREKESDVLQLIGGFLAEAVDLLKHETT